MLRTLTFSTIVSLLCLSGFSQKTVLVELFVSAQDPFSPNLNAAADPGLFNNPKACVIKYHTYWPGTATELHTYNSTENIARIQYYGVNGVPSAFTNADNGSYGAVIDSVNSKYQAAPELQISIPDIEIDTPTLSFDVELTALTSIPAAQLRLVMVQDSVVYSSPPGANGETKFRWVMRDMVPDHDGESVSAMSTNGTASVSYSFDYDTEIGLENYTMVVFLQNQSTKYVYGTACFKPIEILPACNSAEAELCIVSADTATGANIIVWEENLNKPWDRVLIHRETSTTGVFDLLGEVLYSQLSEFVDSNVNIAQQSYRYALSTIDSCGDTSAFSPVHRTVHLQVAQGLNGENVLFWNAYEGFTPATYKIYRKDSTGLFTQINSVSGIQTSYTDLNPPSGVLEYMVELLHPDGCTSTRGDYLSSLSNIFETEATEEPEGIASMQQLSRAFYPNPIEAGDALSIVGFVPGDLIRIHSLDGRVVHVSNPKLGEVEIDLNSGVYLFSVENDRGQRYVGKLVVR